MHQAATISTATPTTTASATGVTGERLRSFIERVERLHEEKKALEEDIKEVYAEAKGDGFCTKTIKALIKIRRTDKDTYREAQALLETYAEALGMEI